ncbi:MAG: hypothetical protein ACRCW9_03225 [Cetobacterium sp.]
MLKLNYLNSQNYRNKILNEINKDLNLEINTGQNSFVYKIMDALSKSNEDKIEIINSLISQNDIQSLSGKSLDNFFNIFNIKRMSYSDGVKEIELSYYGSYDFQIKDSTIIEFNQSSYLTIDKTVFNSTEDIITVKIKVKELINSNIELIDFLELDKLKVDFSGILYNENKKEIFKSNVKENTVINNFSLLETDKEPDESFLNRGTNLFQTLSSDSNFKILNEIRNIENVFDAYIYEEYLTSYVVVIPNSFEALDSCLSYAEEIIEFFKNKKIKIIKPNYVNFSIKNLKNKIPSDYYYQVNQFIKNYIKTIYLKENSFIRNIFIKELINYLSSLNIVNLNINELEIKYQIFLESDLELLFDENKIYENETKTFEPAIYYCEDVI